jgi:hypothetical protein
VGGTERVGGRLLSGIAAVTGLLLALGQLTPVAAAATPVTAGVPLQVAPRQIAYDPDRFQAGNIITDALFYDGYAMSTTEVQNFLAGKGASCTTSGSTVCLKDYRLDQKERAATEFCGAISAKQDVRASAFIATVAKACGISPKVLIVTLEKEQGLVTSTSPTSGRYRIAMGYGCPDTAPCDSAYYGFDNQVYKAASQFERYRLYPYNFNFRVGGTFNIGYSPSASCGTKSVKILSQATAGLYNYTPYTPNKGSLNNYPGTAPCGSYGNRNFFAFYSLWFGSTLVGSNLVRTAGNSSIWLLEGDARWRILGSDPELQQDVRPWGTAATVSGDYLATFEDRGDFVGLFRSPSDAYFLLDGGKRYTVRSCETFTDFGFDCADAVSLAWDLVQAFPVAGDLTAVVKDASGRFVRLGDGMRREVLDAGSASWASIDTTGAVTLTRSTSLDPVPAGPPIVEPGALFTSGASSYVAGASGAYYAIPDQVLSQSQLATWLGGRRGSVSAASIAALGEVPTLPLVYEDPEGLVRMLVPTGSVELPDPQAWVGAAEIPLLGAEIVAGVPPVGATTEGPVIGVTASAGTYWLIDDGLRRSIVGQAGGAKLLGRSLDTTPIRVLSSYLSPLPTGPAYYPPALVVKTDGLKWLIDGTSRRKIPQAVVDETASTPVVIVAAGDIADIPIVGGTMRFGVTCDGQRMLQFDGMLFAVSAAGDAAYSPTTDWVELDPSTCDAMPKHAKVVGPLLSYAGKYWRVVDGERFVITTSKYVSLRETYGAAKAASAGLMAQIPVR